MTDPCEADDDGIDVDIARARLSECLVDRRIQNADAGRRSQGPHIRAGGGDGGTDRAVLGRDPDRGRRATAVDAEHEHLIRLLAGMVQSTIGH